MPNGLKVEPSSDLPQAARQDFMRRALHRFLRRLFFIAVIVTALNFASFLAGTFYLGGSAVKGKIEAGRYYVWGDHRGAKGYDEVSRTAFNYSKWQAYSVIITWPFMILAAFMFEPIRRRPEAQSSQRS